MHTCKGRALADTALPLDPPAPRPLDLSPRTAAVLEGKHPGVAPPPPPSPRTDPGSAHCSSTRRQTPRPPPLCSSVFPLCQQLARSLRPQRRNRHVPAPQIAANPIQRRKTKHRRGKKGARVCVHTSPMSDSRLSWATNFKIFIFMDGLGWCVLEHELKWFVSDAEVFEGWSKGAGVQGGVGVPPLHKLSRLLLSHCVCQTACAKALFLPIDKLSPLPWW